MKRSRRIGTGLLMMLLAVAGRADIEHNVPVHTLMDGAPAAAKLGDVGLFKTYEFMSGGVARIARIYVPVGYHAGRPVGVLFGFHGYMPEKKTEPNLMTLWDLEPYAEDEYFITVALATAYRPEIGGWQYGWKHNEWGLENQDVRAVHELLTMLKANYRIDENRVFANGHSNGAGFCRTAAANLPGVFAAIAPEAPVMGGYVASRVNPFASISYGGTTDTWETAEEMRRTNQKLGAEPAEADFYVLEMGHEPRPPQDGNVEPPLSFNTKIIEFLREHPRTYQTYGFEAAGAELFEDEFDRNLKPAAERWRVETFDGEGILGQLAGYRFNVVGGRLISQAIAERGAQGGICRTQFFTQPALKMEVDLEVRSFGAGGRVVAAWVGDTHGKVYALTVGQGEWAWHEFASHRDFRREAGRLGGGAPLLLEAIPGFSSGAVQQQVQARPGIASGEVRLSRGTTYRVTLERAENRISWKIVDHGTESLVVTGAIPLKNDGAVQWGFGVTGEGAEAAFDNARVSAP